MEISKDNKNGTGGSECTGGEISKEMFARFDKAEKEKVYCENCKYVKRIKIKDRLFYYCILPRFLIDADNLKYNCNIYKRKWWKIWIK